MEARSAARLPRQPRGDRRGVRGGWFHSGDLGYRDEEGFYFIVDRKKELIIRGRNNVYPCDVEEVKAYVETAPGTTATEQELIAYVKTHVAAYRYPRTVEFRAELAKGPTGKIRKKGLESRLP